VTVVRVFVERIRDGGVMRVPLGSVLVGLRIALALQESLEAGGKVVGFDERGERVGEERGEAAKL
jgi:hypothetical protein